MVINYNNDYAYTKGFSFVHHIPDNCEEEHNTPFIISP